MSISQYKYTKKNSFKIGKTITNDKGEFTNREEAVEEFVHNLKEINILQQKLYAEHKEGIVFIFQAMDAAGKDGVIRTVFSTLSPHGVKEFCFKAPTNEELSHDYLWRFWPALPARGNISIFNRSYYEDVLIGKVHKLYEKQILPERINKDTLIETRYREINDFEKYLYGTGTRVVKIFLNVSKDEQALRFISRIDTPRKNWKISEGDIKEREYWDEYQEAFETMINKTSSAICPWYVVPADHKWYARLIVSRIVLETLREANPQFPVVSEENIETIGAHRDSLIDSLSENKRKKYFSKQEEIENEGDSKIGDTDEKDLSKTNEESGQGNIVDTAQEGDNEEEETSVAPDDLNDDVQKSEAETNELTGVDCEKNKQNIDKDSIHKEYEKLKKHYKKNKKKNKKNKKILKHLKNLQTIEEKYKYLESIKNKSRTMSSDDVVINDEPKCPFEDAEDVCIEIITE